MDPESDGLILNQAESVAGATQMQSRIILDLFDINQPHGQRIINKWKIGMATTRQLKQEKPYTNLEEYVVFRGINVGAP